MIELLQNLTVFPVDTDEVRSPKRACTERRNVLVDSNSFRSPVKDVIKSKLPPLQSAFARLIFLSDFFVNYCLSWMLKWLFPPFFYSYCSPTRPNPAAGGETCAETGIGVFFSKVSVTFEAP